MDNVKRLAAITAAVIGLLESPLLAQQQTPPPLTKTAASLQDALPEKRLAELAAIAQEARVTAPAVIARRWEAVQADATANVSRASLLPTVNANASLAQIYEQNQETKGSRMLTAVLYGTGINQPVFHWGALSNSLAASKIQRGVSHRNVEEARRLLLTDLRRQYLNLIVSKRALGNARRTIAALEEEKKWLAVQQREGLVSASVAGAPESRLVDLRLVVRRLENDLHAAQRAMLAACGYNIALGENVPEEIPELPDVSKFVEDLTVVSPENTTPVRLANARDAVKAEQLNLKVINTRLLPKMNMGAGVSQDNRAPDDDRLGPKQLLTTWSASVGFSWAIFDGFSTRAMRQSSKARIRSLEADRDHLERQLQEERHADVEKLTLAWKSLQRAEELLKSTRGSVDFAEKEFREGYGSKRAVLDAQMALDPALQAINIARADCYLAITTYLSNRGQDPLLQSSLASR